ncbi:MAG TPA: YkgJ family cysteine cluster protein [Gemmatimonadales bacterium]|nr:YkgJ family cysteine cluster protein [Gemmatimonadales bacterium]
MSDVAGEYGELLVQLDKWSADAKARHPGVIPCRLGCTACCHGPFDISAADAALLRSGLAALAPAVRAEVRDRARALLQKMAREAPEWGAPWHIEDIGEDRFDDVVEALADEPCPLLGPDGGCLTYAHRPAVCRMMGLGMRTRGGDIDNACPIQDQFPAYAALPPQSFDLEAFERVEERLIARAGGTETTIAAVAGEER